MQKGNEKAIQIANPRVCVCHDHDLERKSGNYFKTSTQTEIPNEINMHQNSGTDLTDRLQSKLLLFNRETMQIEKWKAKESNQTNTWCQILMANNK